LALWLEKKDHRTAKPQLPLKTLAVCSGLAEHGRNNLCYVPGMGSFFQRVGIFSSLPCTDDSWRKPQILACAAHGTRRDDSGRNQLHPQPPRTSGLRKS